MLSSTNEPKGDVVWEHSSAVDLLGRCWLGVPTQKNILFVGESAGDPFRVPKVGAGDLSKTCSMGVVHVQRRSLGLIRGW